MGADMRYEPTTLVQRMPAPQQVTEHHTHVHMGGTPMPSPPVSRTTQLAAVAGAVFIGLVLYSWAWERQPVSVVLAKIEAQVGVSVPQLPDIKVGR